MPRPRQTAPRHQQPAPPEMIFVAEAARRCGWARANTFRERFLATQADADAMGLDYDEDGRALVDAGRVAEAVRQIQAERAAREPDWRIKNLGPHAKKRPTVKKKEKKRRRSTPGAASAPVHAEVPPTE